MTEILDFIEKSQLFGGLPQAVLDKITSVAEKVIASEGQLLFQQGDRADAVWGVISGRVVESIRNEEGMELAVETISPGEIFGEVAVLDWGTQRYEAVAVVDSVLISINRRHFLELLQSSPELCFRLFGQLCSHVRGAGEALEDATLQKFPVRLAKKLSVLVAVDDAGNDLSAGDQEKAELKISQNELAQLLGAKRETINRHLRAWAKEGWLSLARGKILIHDMASLKAMAAPALNGKGQGGAHTQFPYAAGPVTFWGTRSPASPDKLVDGVRKVGLVAIVVADYARHMMGDAAGTLKVLKDGIAAIEKSVSEAKGTILGQIGDSMVIEFKDGKVALNAAKAIHKKISSLNGLQDNEKRQQSLFRVGVHAGEIIVENQRYVGSAIKTALAVAQYANPGGLYLTGSIKDLLHKNQLEELSFLGRQKFSGLDKTVAVFSDRPITILKRIRAFLDSYRRRKVWPAVVSSATLALMVVVWLVAGHFQPAALVAIPQNSIAVLPFENLSSDPEDAFYADGVSLDLMQTLAGYGDLSIRGRESIQNYTTFQEGLQDIGEALRVAYILEGAVFKTGYNFNITARLIKTEDNTQVWSGSFDSDTRDLFTVHQAIASKVAQAMAIKGGSLNAPSVITPVSSNPEAYNLYLKARHHKDMGMTADSLAGIPILEQAITLDPEFAEAYALLAMFYLGFSPSNQLMPLTEEERQQRIRTNLDKAISLKPDSAKVLAASSTISWMEGDYEGALLMGQKAVAQDPNDTDALWALYLGQWHTGNWLATFETLEKLLILEPLSNRALLQYARMLIWIDNLDEARDLVDRVLSVSPDPRAGYVLLTNIALKEDEPLKAIAYTRASRPIGLILDLLYGFEDFDIETINPEIFRIGLYVYAGQYDEAREAINEVFAKTPNSVDHLINLGEVEILAGNLEEGITLMEQGRQLMKSSDAELFSPMRHMFLVSGHIKSFPAQALLYAYRKSGQHEKADKIAEIIIRGMADYRQKLNSIGGRGDRQFLYSEAQLLAIEGQHEAAIATLKRWRDEESSLFNYLRSDPYLETLHSNPEFWKIVAEVEELLRDIREKAAQGVPDI